MPDLSGVTMRSEQQDLLEQLYAKYGSEQFTKRKAPDIPEWPFTRALNDELANWKSH